MTEFRVNDQVGILGEAGIFHIVKIEGDILHLAIRTEIVKVHKAKCKQHNTPQPQKTVPLENIADLANGDLETQAIYLHEISLHDGFEAFKIALAEVIKTEKPVTGDLKHLFEVK